MHIRIKNAWVPCICTRNYEDDGVSVAAHVACVAIGVVVVFATVVSVASVVDVLLLLCCY